MLEMLQVSFHSFCISRQNKFDFDSIVITVLLVIYQNGRRNSKNIPMPSEFTELINNDVFIHLIKYNQMLIIKILHL